MSDYRYKNWESGKNYEEMQAKVFNEANIAKFTPATGDQIKLLTSKDDFDPKTIRYLFDGDEMKGYVQVRIRDKSKESHISFPWVLSGTSSEAQDKLFSEMIDYIKGHDKYKGYKIRINAFSNPESNVKIIEKFGFKKTNDWKTLYLPLSELSQGKYDSEYKSRLATNDDINSLVELMKTDGRYSSQFKEDKDISDYFDKVFQNGHLILIYKNDTLNDDKNDIQCFNNGNRINRNGYLIILIILFILISFI